MATELTRQSRKRSSNSSVVWQHFDLIEGNSKVKCRKCKSKLSYNRSTSVMLEHLKRKHVHIKLHEENVQDSER